MVLEAELLGVEHAQSEVAGLELGVVALRHVHRAPQAEHLAIEIDGGAQVAGGNADEVDAADELLLLRVHHLTG